MLEWMTEYDHDQVVRWVAMIIAGDPMKRVLWVWFCLHAHSILRDHDVVPAAA